MKYIIVGLGKMGLNLAKNFNDHGVRIEGYDVNQEIANQYQHDLFTFHRNLEKLVTDAESLLVMLVLPNGDITNQTVKLMSETLKAGDQVVDFSNSHYQTSRQNCEILANADVKYFDCGLSGGMKGAREGACMMLGNSTTEDAELHQLLSTVCCEGGFAFYEGVGSGHYLKMVHNGIEYGMMQAIGEGLQMLELQPHYQYNLDNVLGNWSNGSIIESALLANAHNEIKKDTKLYSFSEHVFSSGEANWMVKESVDLAIPIPIITQSLIERYRSQLDNHFSNRAVSAMRYNFGGHNEVKG